MGLHLNVTDAPLSRVQALFEHVKDKPDLTVDDMLWWLYDTYKIVVGTRTIRRVFERKGEAGNRFKKSKQEASFADAHAPSDDGDDDGMISPTQAHGGDQYRSPYAPMAAMTPQSANHTEMQLAQALQQNVYPPPPSQPEIMSEAAEDEETLQLELQQIALERREIELKLRMRRIQQGKSPGSPPSSRKQDTPQSALSTLFKPGVGEEATPPKRDSRSKKKIEESKKRTAERQERMLRDLERRSRRRDHLTAEWVQSKDIWPLRAQGTLADLMHQYGCYAFSQNNVGTFEEMYRDLYALVDHSKGDWDPHVHDELLRERMKRKMAQLRTKMQKTGEIIGRGDGFSGWQKAEDYTGQHAGDVLGDDTDADMNPHDHPMQAQSAALGGPSQHDHQMHYDAVPDPTQQHMQHAQLPYGNAPLMQPNAPYPIMDAHHGMLPYGQMPPQQGMGHSDGMVM